jgi:hypothetical protein
MKEADSFSDFSSSHMILPLPRAKHVEVNLPPFQLGHPLVTNLYTHSCGCCLALGEHQLHGVEDPIPSRAKALMPSS